MLNRELIFEALTRLSEVLESRGVQGELYLVGGARNKSLLSVYPEGQVLPKTRFMLEEIFSAGRP